MNRRWCWILIALTVGPAVWAQREPHIGYVYPAGGQLGTTFQATIGGQFLDNANSIAVSGRGVHAILVEQTKLLTFKQAKDLRDRLKELLSQKPDTANAKEIAEIRKQLIKFASRSPAPAIAETVIIEITIDRDAPLGNRELRLQTAIGLSNPRIFQVDQLPEYRKKDIATNEDAVIVFNRRVVQKATPPTESTITLPAILNGQILPGGVDRYHFQGRPGQQLVVAVNARTLIPYLADAVPGWFQAAISLYDSKGKEVAHNDHFRFSPDPVILYPVGTAGEYTLEIRDALYRGREDFVYRVEIGELPFLSSLFPLGGKAGEPATVELRGWNLPVTTLALGTTNHPPGILPVSVRNRGLVSNTLPFALDTLPEVFEQGTNAQPVTLPVIINGRIDAPGNVDVFRFEGHAGDKLVAEVIARRLESPVDSFLKLTNADGKQLAFNDDHEDKASGLNTHHADSYLSTTLPADGVYFISIGDTQRAGGPQYAYRLRLSAPQPDFALRVVPSAVSLRGGGNAPVTVYALRKDGFDGTITLALRNAPQGFKLAGEREVNSKQDSVRLTLSVPASARGETVPVQLEGRAMIAGREVVHAAVPAEDMTQAFAYRHLVPAQEFVVAVSERPSRAAMKVLSGLPVRIPLGGTTRVEVSTPTDSSLGKIEFELSGAPDGIAMGEVKLSAGKAEIELHSDAEKVTTGQKGNLIVNAFTTRTPEKQTGKPPGNARRVSIGPLPAIPFEISSP
jgi:hypothetical protein